MGAAPARLVLIASGLLAVAVAGAGCGPARDDGVGKRAVVEEPGAATPPDDLAFAFRRPAPGEPGGRAGGGEKYALVIGVSSYADRRVPPLRFARADAEAVWSYFVSDRPGLGIPSANSAVLLDEKATGPAIEAALRRLNEAAGPGDTAIIYFAGHGAVDLEPGGGLRGNYLVPHDAVALDGQGGGLALDVRTGFPLSRLQELLQQNRADSVLVVLDACFSGGTGQSFSRVRLGSTAAAESEKELERLRDAGRGRSILTATAPNQPALELEPLGHGLFTHYFLEGLGNDENRDLVVTLPEVYSYVFPRVRDRARGLRHEQTPMLHESRAGILALRELPWSKLRVGFEVGYVPAGRLTGRNEAAVRPESIPAPAGWSVRVDALEQGATIHVYLLRVVRSATGVRVARLIPDGENAAAPRTTVAAGRDAVFPSPDHFRDPFVAVPPGERDAHVAFVLIAAEAPIDLGTIDALGARLSQVAAEGDADLLGRALARVVDAEPALRGAAVKYAIGRHGRGL